MTIGLKVDNIVTELGSSGFLHSFFSTVSHRLETNGWGTRFPMLLNELYQGTLSKAHASEALRELNAIAREMKQLSPQHVVWDIDDLSKRPPWGSNISPEITDLSNYFVTSTGRDLIEVLRECLEYFAADGSTCDIVEV